MVVWGEEGDAVEYHACDVCSVQRKAGGGGCARAASIVCAAGEFWPYRKPLGSSGANAAVDASVARASVGGETRQGPDERGELGVVATPQREYDALALGAPSLTWPWRGGGSFIPRGSADAPEDGSIVSAVLAARGGGVDDERHGQRHGAFAQCFLRARPLPHGLGYHLGAYCDKRCARTWATRHGASISTRRYNPQHLCVVGRLGYIWSISAFVGPSLAKFRPVLTNIYQH